MKLVASCCILMQHDVFYKKIGNIGLFVYFCALTIQCLLCMPKCLFLFISFVLFHAIADAQTINPGASALTIRYGYTYNSDGSITSRRQPLALSDSIIKVAEYTVKASPILAVSEITVEIDGCASNECPLQYTITGVNGSIFGNGKIEALPVSIDVSQLPSGNYILTVNSNSTAIGSVQFIKQ